jgi:V/A-type H+-transporting ATPase subunit I
MIVPMKKLTLVVMEDEKQESLKQLARLGVLDIKASTMVHAESQELAVLKEKQDILHKALVLLDKPEKSVSERKRLDQDKALKYAGEILQLEEDMHHADDRQYKLSSEFERVSPWGNFKPDDIMDLKQAGIQLRFYEVKPKKLDSIPENVNYIMLAQDKKTVRIACITEEQLTTPALKEFHIPEMSLSEIEKAINGLEKQKSRLQRLLSEKARYFQGLNRTLQTIEKKIEFEEAHSSMMNEAQLSHITGFAPLSEIPRLKRTASAQGWALLIEDPGEDDPVPTLVKNPKWIRIIKPVFDFLGTVPGYREYDISLWFLLFFSIFFGILIGDAGYGVVFFVLTLVARVAARKAPPEPFALMFVTSLVTVIWGGITGTWFGSEAIAGSPLVSWMIIPQIYSFKDGDTSAILMQFCFLLGTVHLGIARIRSFIRRLPKLKAFAELGWLCIIAGMYFIVLFLILKQDLNPLIIYLIGGGIFLVIVFSEQQGKFIKGALIGLVKLPLNVLSVISTFADVVSYVRLFAVGLSALEIAKAFNGMAADVGFEGFAVVGAVIILFLGHLLNIVLGIMAVVVHGVRLNMLEFSGHLGMEWTGRPYKPFTD